MSGGGGKQGRHQGQPGGVQRHGQGKKQGQGKQQGQGKPRGGKGGRAAQGTNPAEELKQPLERVLSRLPETQRKVLELRMGLTDGHPHDLADTARALGLSLGETREIEQRAFEHIREAVPLQQLQRFLQG